MNMASKENVNTKKSTIVILGAGIIGLTTAYELSKVGHFNVHVVEKRNDVCSSIKTHASEREIHKVIS